MANLHIIHLTLEFKYESRIGLTMIKKSQKYDKALIKPKMQAKMIKTLSLWCKYRNLTWMQANDAHTSLKTLVCMENHLGIYLGILWREWRPWEDWFCDSLVVWMNNDDLG